MMQLEQLLTQLVEAVTQAPGQPDAEDLVVTDLDLDLPVEARIAADGSVLMSLPRGLLATGFMLPLGRLRMHCEEPRP